MGSLRVFNLNVYSLNSSVPSGTDTTLFTLSNSSDFPKSAIYSAGITAINGIRFNASVSQTGKIAINPSSTISTADQIRMFIVYLV